MGDSKAFRNRYQPELTPEEELASDMEFEEFLTLSEAEIDRRLEVEARLTAEWWSKLTPLQQYRSNRRAALSSCITNRNAARMLPLDFMRERLREAQMRLVQIRAFRAAGFVGSARQ